MNERIKQLAEQATETVKCGLNGTSTTESFNRKKFAELIIDDCAKLVDHVRMEDGTNRGDFIRKHFGVKE